MSYLLIALLFSVRPVDPTAIATLDFAFQRSAMIRQLIDTLERSNVIVHIQSARELPSGIAGMTRFAVSRSGYRYLRITIDARLPLTARGIILGHELQHACEIAASSADDVASLRALFDRAGRRIDGFYDTREAVIVEKHVGRELSAPNGPIGSRR